MTRGDRERLRAELAGKAMAAIISKSPFKVVMIPADERGEVEIHSATAIGSVLYADALLTELERTEEPIKAGGTE